MLALLLLGLSLFGLSLLSGTAIESSQELVDQILSRLLLLTLALVGLSLVGFSLTRVQKLEVRKSRGVFSGISSSSSSGILLSLGVVLGLTVLGLTFTFGLSGVVGCSSLVRQQCGGGSGNLSGVFASSKLSLLLLRFGRCVFLGLGILLSLSCSLELLLILGSLQRISLGLQVANLTFLPSQQHQPSSFHLERFFERPVSDLSLAVARPFQLPIHQLAF